MAEASLNNQYTYGPDPYLQTEPPSEITDPELGALGYRAKGRLRGAPRINESLYPEYKKRSGAANFFVSGKVFKALWPELLGQANESVTVTSETKFGEKIATKIRWFIVVNPGLQHCTCLPIATYNKQGVAKPGVVKNHHAIAYTSNTAPQQERSERPLANEGDPMLPSIRIVPKSRRYGKMDKMSRIDFSRMYTVEHNVKVFDFGNVHPAHLGRLRSHWIQTLTNGGGQQTVQLNNLYAGGGGAGGHDGADDDEAEEEDVQDDDEEDPAEEGHDAAGGYPYYRH